MSEKSSKSSPRFSVSFDSDTYQEIKNIADKNGSYTSDVIRTLVKKALSIEYTKESLDLITQVMESQLKAALMPYMERQIALTAKTCIQASTAAYLTAETIAQFVPPSLQKEYQEVYEKARKKAIREMKKPDSLKN